MAALEAARADRAGARRATATGPGAPASEHVVGSKRSLSLRPPLSADRRSDPPREHCHPDAEDGRDAEAPNAATTTANVTSAPRTWPHAAAIRTARVVPTAHLRRARPPSHHASGANTGTAIAATPALVPRPCLHRRLAGAPPCVRPRPSRFPPFHGSTRRRRPAGGGACLLLHARSALARRRMPTRPGPAPRAESGPRPRSVRARRPHSHRRPRTSAPPGALGHRGRAHVRPSPTTPRPAACSAADGISVTARALHGTADTT